MPTNYAITSSNGGTWSIQQTNTATVGRYHDLSLLMEGDKGSNQLNKSRAGVLPAGANSGGNLPLSLFVVTAGSGLQAKVYLGAAIVERSTLAGAYLVQSRSTGQITLDPADSTNPRIDRIDLQVFDGALGDNGNTSLTQIVVTTGNAAASPSVPAAPANSIPLAVVNLPAGTQTLTQAMISDVRRSAGIRGAVRVLLPGDGLSDAGNMIGELRDTSAVQNQGTIDRWNEVTGQWETVYLIGTGAGFARYLCTDGTSTVANGAVLTFNFANPQSTCPDVTASGTNNTTFGINRTGQWRFENGMRIKYATAATSGDFYLRCVRVSDSVEIGGITDNAYGPLFVVRSYSFTKRMNAGDQVQFKLTNSTNQTMTLNPAGELFFCSLKWVGP